MNTVFHAAASRGHAEHGWLDSWHTFSFASYHDPTRVHFGALRVLNDDTVAAGHGFGKHPHENMEIISIPLEGALKHIDTMGNQGVIRPGDVQLMSAGTGLMHAEMNASDTEPVKFLQIWIIPKIRNVTPQYRDRSFNPAGRDEKWQLLISPDGRDDSLESNQDAWLSIGKYKSGQEIDYTFRSEGTGLYVFIISGKVQLDDQLLNKRDGIGITDTQRIELMILEDSELLLIEVPVGYL